MCRRMSRQPVHEGAFRQTAYLSNAFFDGSRLCLPRTDRIRAFRGRESRSFRADFEPDQ
jgi:hypothetical protein